jgi:hypothetical protein
MNKKLIEVDEGEIFYCNNCKQNFLYIYTFTPIPGLTEYYTCDFCNSILPVKDLKKRRLRWIFNCCFYK